MNEIRPRRPLHGYSLLTHYEYVHSSPTPSLRSGNFLYDQTTTSYGSYSPIDNLRDGGSGYGSGRQSRESRAYSERGYLSSPGIRAPIGRMGGEGSSLTSENQMRDGKGYTAFGYKYLGSPMLRTSWRSDQKTPDGQAEYVSKQFPGYAALGDNKILERRYEAPSVKITTSGETSESVQAITAARRLSSRKNEDQPVGYDRSRVDHAEPRYDSKGAEKESPHQAKYVSFKEAAGQTACATGSQDQGTNQALGARNFGQSRPTNFRSEVQHSASGSERISNISATGNEDLHSNTGVTSPSANVPDDPVQPTHYQDATAPLFDSSGERLNPKDDGRAKMDEKEDKPKFGGRYFGLFQTKREKSEKADEQKLSLENVESKENTGKTDEKEAVRPKAIESAIERGTQVAASVALGTEPKADGQKSEKSRLLHDTSAGSRTKAFHSEKTARNSYDTTKPFFGIRKLTEDGREKQEAGQAAQQNLGQNWKTSGSENDAKVEAIPASSDSGPDRNRAELNIRVGRRGKHTDFRTADDNADLPGDEDREVGGYKSFKIIGFIKKSRDSSDASIDSDPPSETKISSEVRPETPRTASKSVSRAKQIRELQARRAKARQAAQEGKYRFENDATRPLFDYPEIFEEPEQNTDLSIDSEVVKSGGEKTKAQTDEAAALEYDKPKKKHESEKRHHEEKQGIFRWFNKEDTPAGKSEEASSRKTEEPAAVQGKYDGNRKGNKLVEIRKITKESASSQSGEPNYRTKRMTTLASEPESSRSLQNQPLEGRLSKSHESISHTRHYYNDATTPLFESDVYVSSPALDENNSGDYGRARVSQKQAEKNTIEKQESSKPQKSASKTLLSGLAKFDQKVDVIFDQKRADSPSINDSVSNSFEPEKSGYKDDQILKQSRRGTAPSGKGKIDDENQKNSQEEPGTSKSERLAASHEASGVVIDAVESLEASERPKKEASGSIFDRLFGIKEKEADTPERQSVSQNSAKNESPKSTKQAENKKQHSFEQEIGTGIVPDIDDDPRTDGAGPKLNEGSSNPLLSGLEKLDRGVGRLFNVKRTSEDADNLAKPKREKSAFSDQADETEFKKDENSQIRLLQTKAVVHHETEIEPEQRLAVEDQSRSPSPAKKFGLDGIIQKYREHQEYRLIQHMESPYWKESTTPQNIDEQPLNEPTELYSLPMVESACCQYMVHESIEHVDPTVELTLPGLLPGHAERARTPSGHSSDRPHQIHLRPTPYFEFRRSSDLKPGEEKTFFTKGTSMSVQVLDRDRSSGDVARIQRLRESSKSEELLYERLADSDGKYSLGIQASGN